VCNELSFATGKNSFGREGPRQVGSNDCYSVSPLRSLEPCSSPSIRKNRRRWLTLRTACCPNGLSYQTIPFGLTLMAAFLTGFGSWSCTYFSGARIGFLGDTYGLWTLQDYGGKCQLWDVLFFSYHLDGALLAARVLSMSAMVLGLAMLTTMSLAMQNHFATWGIGLVFVLLLIASLATTNIFNVWIVFWLFSYIILILIIRALFIHPVHRRISARGSTCIAICMALCMILTLTTLVVLSSKYCTCETLTNGQLENRIVGDPCSGTCRLEVGGYVMMLSSFFWSLAAIATLKIGVQPKKIHVKDLAASHAMYGGFVGTPILSGARRAVSKSQLRDENHGNSESKPPLRGLRQRVCCDYRITQRSRREMLGFWFSRVVLTIVVLVYLFIVIMFIGSRAENDIAANAPDTSPNFILDPVCAFSSTDTALPFQTFPTADDARKANLTVAHCGPCGYCSNLQDIETYVNTRRTVAVSAKQCGPVSVLGSYDALVNCLEEKINFSRACTTCWADNMKSTAAHCLFTCMKTLFTGFMANNNVPDAGQSGWLNQCLQCDEKMSGTAFVTCSGVARRRLGIASEIERNPAEQCKTVGENWLTFFDTESP
jgi:hypothetical protein